MSVTPLAPGLRPGGAAEIERDLEHPVHTISAGQSQALARLRRQRAVECIHRLGARVVFELIDELARHYGLADDLDRHLARYAALDPEVLCALGADGLPVWPVRSFGGAT